MFCMLVSYTFSNLLSVVLYVDVFSAFFLDYPEM